MNTLLKIFGIIFLAISLLLAAAVAVFVFKGFALQKSAATYVETNVPLIVKNWNSEEVTKRAAPEFLIPSVREGLPTVFQHLSGLGKLKRLEKAKGGVVVADLQLAFRERSFFVGVNKGQLQPIWAELVADAEFEAGPAKVKMTLVQRGNDWRIMGFWVGPPTEQ